MKQRNAVTALGFVIVCLVTGAACWLLQFGAEWLARCDPKTVYRACPVVVALCVGSLFLFHRRKA